MLAILSFVAMMGFLADETLVEALRDAQVTHRERWSRGRASILVEASTPRAAGTARIEGEIAWLESSFILKYKVSDPEGILFIDRGVGLDRDGNFVAKGKDFVVTYAARNNVLNERSGEANSFLPVFDLSPFAGFAYCCPPSFSRGRPWKEMIGPGVDLPAVLKDATYTHRRLPDGDIEQIRRNDTGHLNTIIFSSKNNMAVSSVQTSDPAGKVLGRVQFTYTRGRDGGPVPSTCDAERSWGKPAETINYKYSYKNVVLHSGVGPAEFTRESVLARIRRETDYGRSRAQRPDSATDDATLDAIARGLREQGTAKP